MNFNDLVRPDGNSNKGQCVYPMRDSRGKTVLCGEATLLDGEGNHMAFCSKHRKDIESRFREIWEKKKARLGSGRKKTLNKYNHMKINQLVMR